MKNIICVFIVFCSLTVSFGQDPIKNYPGIPIISDMGLKMEYAPPVEQFHQADTAGIFALNMSDLDTGVFNSRISPTNLLVIPVQSDMNLLNHIATYTDARYTVFEAEGTSPEDGLITLYNNRDTLNLTVANGAVSTTQLSEHGTMIYGPMYRQCRNFFTTVNGTQTSDSIVYEAEFWLKVENLPNQYSSPHDTVCILQVTATKTWKEINGKIQWGFYDTTEIAAERVITYGEFDSVGSWQNFILEYSFTHDFPYWKPAGEPFPGTSYKSILAQNIQNQLEGKISQNCVEFKVLWRGKKDKIKFSVDKVIVSDWRGRRLKNPISYQEIKTNIETQIYWNKVDFDQRVAAFIGVDEPWSIDQWEPIRMVNEIIDSYSPNAKLYINFNVQSEGRFAPWPDTVLGSRTIVIDEFMRRVKKANLWVTGWLYDIPCDGSNTQPWWFCEDANDIRLRNIDIFADSIYKRVMDAGKTYPGLHYGFSVQTGKYGYADEHKIREINSHELLYQTNLTLMYGTKILFPWLYFGGWDIPATYTGFRNAPYFEVTDKYNTLRDTISPRLSGLMGQTLRKLVPTNQYAGSRGINYTGIVPWSLVAGGYEYIEDIIPQVLSTDEYGLDLGFFVDSLYTDKNYFMVLNRYYSTSSKYYIKLRNLDGFINWNLKNYVDTTSSTLLAVDNKAQFLDTLYRGDANLYSIAPVAKHGGNLIADEIVGESMILYDDMVITNGATLTIVSDYYAYGNIIIENGSIDIYTDQFTSAPKINFYDGKKLIIKGPANLSGTQEDKLTLDFITADNENGIVIEEGGTLTISNCIVKNAQAGILGELNVNYLNAENVDFIDCSDYAVLLHGQSMEQRQSTTPPPAN